MTDYSPRQPTLCLLALSAIADDPRVRRQGDAFDRAGWRVIGVGAQGARSQAPKWRIITQPSGTTRTGEPGRASLIERLLVSRSKRPLPKRLFYGFCLLAVRWWPAIAEQVNRAADPRLRELAAGARDVCADIWLANDWNTLPLAARLAAEKGGIYTYDTHEFATEEFGHKPVWRLLRRPLVRTLEGAYIGGAAVVSAVSSGIARALDQSYRLPARCLVIRNTPPFETPRFRPTGSVIRVLYHGIVAPGRGLEAAIASVALWRHASELTIRGPGEDAYLDALRRQIDALGLDKRVHLAPPVPMTHLVREAAAFDIGLFALPGTSRHNRFALPNKIFEYVMAGLALCVSGLPEMDRLVRQYALGVTFDAVTPAAIGAALNALDGPSIDAYKRNALEAARQLCWEREAEALVSAYRTALCARSITTRSAARPPA